MLQRVRAEGRRIGVPGEGEGDVELGEQAAQHVLDALLAGQRQPVAAVPLHLYVAWVGEEQRSEAFRIAVSARRTGHSVKMELAGRSLKGQLKQADRAGARYVAILGDEGTALKDMETGEQRTVEPGTVMHHIRSPL